MESLALPCLQVIKYHQYVEWKKKKKAERISCVRYNVKCLHIPYCKKQGMKSMQQSKTCGLDLNSTSVTLGKPFSLSELDLPHL
jgi:hypothetical protein